MNFIKFVQERMKAVQSDIKQVRWGFLSIPQKPLWCIYVAIEYFSLLTNFYNVQLTPTTTVTHY